jgi:cyclophilin family peptidyl-prolyl cis-trans isomerase
LDGAHVVFGKVVEGYDIVQKIEASKTNKDDKPLKEAKIANCGQL